MNELDKKLLAVLQADIPVVQRPWADIASRLGTQEQEVLKRISELKSTGLIRQISAIFDTAALGYASTLVAAQVDLQRVDAAAALINAHPGVSHNYLRNHAFNLWYTLAVSPRSRLGLERTVQILHEQSGALRTRLLPTIRRFKLGVILNLEDDTETIATETAASPPPQQRPATPLTQQQLRYVREMQRDLPLLPTPFLAVAERLGISLAELQHQTTLMRQSGRLRRIAAVLHHRSVGFAANAMAVWAVSGDEDSIRQVGEQMAAFRAVTHCYQRPTYPDWPYNLFTMIHARSRSDCEAVVEQIARQTGVTDYALLYSIKEYKKIRLQYFTEAEAAWESEHGHNA